MEKAAKVTEVIRTALSSHLPTPYRNGPAISQLFQFQQEVSPLSIDTTQTQNNPEGKAAYP
jgi:hypothetical protein